MNEFLILTAIILALYLLPTIIAIRRQHLETVKILLLNIVLGWTLLGWVFCLMKACREDVGTTGSEPIIEENAQSLRGGTHAEPIMGKRSGLSGLKPYLLEPLKMLPRILVSPAKFFASMPKSGGFLEPLIFAVLMGTIAGLIQVVIMIFGGQVATSIIAESTRVLILGPAVLVLLSFSGAAILYMMWNILGSKEPYAVAFRCWTYIFAIFPILPLIRLSPVLSFVTRTVLVTIFIIIASEKVHLIPPYRSRTFFAVIAMINFFLYFILTKVHLFSD